ncbi:MAG: hypothetical protein ACRENL_04955 [Candidatus Dormibacteria bacterium]
MSVDPFSDARAAALIANQVARDVMRHLEEATPPGVAANMAVVEAVSATFPQHPLHTAVRDLAVATLASSRAALSASQTDVPEHARAVGEAARSAARTLSLAEVVAGSTQLRGQAEERARVAHAASLTAFAAADLLRGQPGLPARSASPIRFPASWRRVIEILGSAIDVCRIQWRGEQSERLIDAAVAARDGAGAACRAYDRAARVSGSAPALCRFVRLAALSAAYAGCAAVIPLRSPSPHGGVATE